jgi:hypothetical protein
MPNGIASSRARAWGASSDPKDCRAHARRYVQLAAEAKEPLFQKHYKVLAKRWAGLAIDLEKTGSLKQSSR